MAPLADTDNAGEGSNSVAIAAPQGAIAPTDEFPTPLKMDCRSGMGLVSETVDWICKTSVFEQPEMALLNVFAALGAVFGRRYASTTDIRTNLYCCITGNTTSGKDHSRKMVDKLMTAAGLDTFLGGGSISSGGDIVTELVHQPSHIMMIDEFGLVLESITNGKMGGAADISVKLLDIFTSSEKDWRGGNRGKNGRLIIHQPNLCIYGTTTVSTYLAALRKISISSGMMNRFIVLPGRENPKVNTSDMSRDVPGWLLVKWRELVNGDAEKLNRNVIGASPKVVAWAEGCKEYFDMLLMNQVRYCADKQHGIEMLYGRYREMVTKFAMIIAICRNTRKPEINIQDFISAEKIVQASIFYIKDLATNHMYENMQQKVKRDVAAILKGAGPEGMWKGDLNKQTWEIKGSELDEILKSLIEQGSVWYEKRDGKFYYGWNVRG